MGKTNTVLVPTLSIAEVVNNANSQSYLPQAGSNLGKASRAGVQIVAGTDSMVGAMPADTLHHELQLMVEAGLTQAQALQSATGNAAKLLQLQDRGLVTAGMVADLVLLNSDPLEGIESLADIAVVFQNGQIVHEGADTTPVALSDYVPPQNGVERFSTNPVLHFHNTLKFKLIRAGSSQIGSAQ